MASWWGCNPCCSNGHRPDDEALAEVNEFPESKQELPGLSTAERWDGSQLPQRAVSAAGSDQIWSAQSCQSVGGISTQSSGVLRRNASSDTSPGGPSETSSIYEPKTPSSTWNNAGGFVDTNSLGLPQDVIKVLKQAEESRSSGYIFAAERTVLALVNRLTEEGKLDILEKAKRSQEYVDLIAQLEEVNRMLSALLDDNGWTLQKEADRILVWTRPEPGTDLVTVRLAGIIEGPYDGFCAVGKEVALIKTWMPGVKTSSALAQLNVFDHIAYYVWKFPLVSAREFLIEEVNMINDEEGYCLAMRQPPHEREGVDLPAPQKGVVRAAASDWYTFSAPIGQKNIFSVSVMNVDLKIPLPNWLVNRLSISMGYQSFQDLRQNTLKSSDPTSPFCKAVASEEGREYYDRMRSLDKVRETKSMPCFDEILKTGWVKDPESRKKIFNRSSGVLVPL